MIMHSYVLFSTTNKYLHMLTSECCAVLVTMGIFALQPLALTLNQITHAYHFISKFAHKVNLQSRAVNVFSSMHTDALKEGVNYLFYIRHSTVLQATMCRNTIFINQILIPLEKLLI